MKKLLLLFLPLLLCTCISRDYRYYVDRGDRILEGFPADSPAHLRYTTDEMCIYRETIAGESGDYTNIHIQYYDADRRLVAYKRISYFFNSLCYDGVLTEVSLYSFDGEAPQEEIHSFHREDGSVLEDTLHCQFPYRYDYQLELEYLDSYK